MRTKRHPKKSEAHDSKNSVTHLDLHDAETVINITATSMSSNESVAGASAVTLRRSTRQKKAPVKLQFPYPDSSPQRPAKVKRLQKEKSVTPPKKQRKKPLPKTGTTGSKMTEYEKMIQKNIQERNAFLANLLKLEGSYFEEEKPKKNEKRKRHNSVNNEEKTVKQQPPRKKKKVASRKRKSSENEDEEKTITHYITKRRTAKATTRGIYREVSSSHSLSSSDAASEHTDVSDTETLKRKTRSSKKELNVGTVTRRFAQLVQERSTRRSRQHAKNIVYKEIGENDGTGEDDENAEKMEDDQRDDPNYSGDSSTGESEDGKDSDNPGEKVERKVQDDRKGGPNYSVNGSPANTKSRKENDAADQQVDEGESGNFSKFEEKTKDEHEATTEEDVHVAKTEEKSEKYKADIGNPGANRDIEYHESNSLTDVKLPSFCENEDFNGNTFTTGRNMQEVDTMEDYSKDATDEAPNVNTFSILENVENALTEQEILKLMENNSGKMLDADKENGIPKESQEDTITDYLSPKV